MQDVERILVMTQSTERSNKGVHYRISLAKELGGELYVLHVFDDLFELEHWQLPIPSLKASMEGYQATQEEVRKTIDAEVESEQADDLPIQVLVRDGDPVKPIIQVIKEKKIDLPITTAFHEGRLEHLLFGRTNEKLLRQLPCSVLFAKKEPQKGSVSGLTRMFPELMSRDREDGRAIGQPQGGWSRGVPERYVAGANTRGRPEGRPDPWSQQAIHGISGLGVFH
jgi:nucleotide-binding universal stress UspA family protein